MQAYRKVDLYNQYVQENAAEALQTGCISANSYSAILQAFPRRLYTPNYFIRIALGLLTIVTILFGGLLLFIITAADSYTGAAILLAFLAISCYLAAELLVKRKRYYNAGVDNILISTVIIFFVSAFFAYDSEASWLVVSAAATLISLWLSIRFTDACMAVVTYCCLFVFFFLLYSKAGNFAKATTPFVMMTLSAFAYFISTRLISSGLFMYHFCFKSVAFLALITFYASGNYFVVSILGAVLFDLPAGQNSFTLDWLFWLFTLAIPLVYVICGVIKKDFILMRTGLMLIAAAIFTIKYFFDFLPVEMILLISGAVLIVISYALTRYLKTPKYGYTSEDLYPFQKDALQVEALIVAETFNGQPQAQPPGLYGGGSGGGGGATSDF